MPTLRRLGAIGLVSLLAAAAAATGRAQQINTSQVAIDSDDIGGVVRGPSGPEAGVWVIAETTDLPTKFARIVVTDDQGRYVIPDLPKAKYKVWVRGYGLVDSPKVDGEPGQAPRPHRGARAERGGGGAVLSGDLLVLDAEDPGGEPVRRQERAFPRRSPRSTGSSTVKNRDCIGCHQLGQLSTRTIPPRSASSSRARKPGSAACSRGSRARTW